MCCGVILPGDARGLVKGRPSRAECALVHWLSPAEVNDVVAAVTPREPDCDADQGPGSTRCPPSGPRRPAAGHDV